MSCTAVSRVSCASLVVSYVGEPKQSTRSNLVYGKITEALKSHAFREAPGFDAGA